MEFNFLMPTKVYFGQGTVLKNAAEFARWGKKAMLVTGRNSARISGALTDVTAALHNQGIDWIVFDQIEENPSLANVTEAGEIARRFAPDMIIGIGGGSPLDAAKAIAMLAVNTIPAAELFGGVFPVAPLPILAIPLTAGTGSEVTPYAILTDPAQQTKKSFAHPDIFPKVAFLDPVYTQSQSVQTTINTAVDALSHAVEGFLSRKGTPITNCIAQESIRYFGRAISAMKNGEFSLVDRENVLYASLLGGMVIAQTGTTAVHAMGYSLTYFRDVPHGRANGLLLAEYLRFNQHQVPDKVEAVLAALGLTNVDSMKTLLESLLPSTEVYSEADFSAYINITLMAKNLVNTPRIPDRNDLMQLFKNSLIWG